MDPSLSMECGAPGAVLRVIPNTGDVSSRKGQSKQLGEEDCSTQRLFCISLHISLLCNLTAHSEPGRKALLVLPLLTQFSTTDPR